MGKSVAYNRNNFQGAQCLVQEQLDSGHINQSNFPWYSIFMIKKKSLKWRLIQDLREVNRTMQLIVALQPVLPYPILCLKTSISLFLIIGLLGLFLYYFFGIIRLSNICF